MDLDEVWFKAVVEKPGGIDGAERELEKGIWESEGVEAETGGDRLWLRLKYKVIFCVELQEEENRSKYGNLNSLNKTSLEI